jgi:signal transduction histidine kinase
MKLYLYFLFFFLLNFLCAQDLNEQIDENYQKYRKLADFDQNQDSALLYILKAKELNQQKNDPDWNAKIYYGIGYSYLKKQQYVKAIQNFSQAVDFAKKSDNTNILSKAYNQLGLVYSYQNNFKKALDNYHKSLEISENKEELSDNTLSVLSNIADLHILQQDTLSALKYYHQAIKIGERENNKLNLANVFNNVAVVYMKSNKDSTELYFNKALQIYKDINNIYGQIITQNNLASTYLNFHSKKDYPKSFQYLSESLDFSKKTNNVDLEYFSYYYLANYYDEAENNLQKAKNYYESAYQLLKEGYKNDYAIELYKSISEVYLKLGEFKNAYEFQKIQYDLQDSIFSVQKNKQFHEIQTKFDVERKNNQIQLLSKEKEIEKSNKRLILIGSGLLIITLLILAVFYRKRMKYQETISKQDKVIFEKEKETIRVKNVIKGQNLERKRISKELHDGVGGRLSAIKIKMDQLNTTVIRDPDLEHCIEQLQETAKEIRVISHELKDNKITELNFVTLLNHLIDDYRFYFSGEMTFNIFPEEKYENITGFKKHYLYRVIQEILSNCLKYADARNIHIDCTFDDVYRIIIEDDGKGFDLKNIKKGMGIGNIQKRVSKLKGSVHIDSMEGRGSTFIIEIPENGRE